MEKLRSIVLGLLRATANSRTPALTCRPESCPPQGSESSPCRFQHVDIVVSFRSSELLSSNQVIMSNFEGSGWPSTEAWVGKTLSADWLDYRPGAGEVCVCLSMCVRLTLPRKELVSRIFFQHCTLGLSINYILTSRYLDVVIINGRS